MTKNILIAGCGALGSQIALHLAHHPDLYLVLLDHDRVDSNNILNGTSRYLAHHEGQLKVNALSELVWSTGRHAHKPMNKRLTQANILSVLRDIDLVIDCFDNALSRNLLHNWPDCDVLHVGITSDRVGVITWDKDWEYLDPDSESDNIVCTHELGAPVLRLTATLASNIVEIWLHDDVKKNATVTQDLRIWK